MVILTELEEISQLRESITPKQFLEISDMDLSKEKLEELMKRLPPENKTQCDLSPFKEISNPSREDKRPECTSCGEIIDSDSAFCKYCGTKIEG